MQNEIAMLKMQMGIMEKDYKRRIQTLEDRNIDLTMQLEETRRSAEQRVDNLYKEMKQSAISTVSEPIIRYEYIKTPQASSVKSLSNYNNQSQTSSQSNRQLENLNLVLETKMQEIKALEERLLLLKHQHQQQQDQLTQHYENILKTKVKNELAAANVQHERLMQQNQIDLFNMQYKMKASDERFKKIIDDKDKLIDELQFRIQELENNDLKDQLNLMQQNNIRITEEFNMMKKDFKAELELLNDKHQGDLQLAFQQGFEQGDSNQKAQNELQKINGLYKQVNDKALKLEAENRQVNLLLSTYQQEIQEWKDKYQTTIIKQKEEIEKLRQSFDRQKKEQLDLTFNAEYLQEKNKLLFQLEQCNKQIQQLQQINEKNEKELKYYYSESFNASQLNNEIQQLQRQLQINASDFENYKKKSVKIEKQQQDDISRLTLELKNIKNNLANSTEDRHKALQERQIEIDQLNDQIYEFEQQNKNYLNEIERLKKEIKQQKQQYQVQIDQKNEEISQLNEKIGLLSMERYNFEQQLNKQKSQNEQQMQTLQKNQLLQNEAIDQLNQELEEEKNNSQLLLNKEQSYKQQIQQLNSQIKELQYQNEQLIQEIQNIQDQLSSYEQEIQNFDFERKKKQEQIGNLEKKYKNAVEELQMKEDELNEQTSNHYNELEQQKSDYSKQHEQQRKEVQKLVNQIQDREIQIQQYEDQVSKLQSENSKLKNQAQLLQNENNELEQQIKKYQVQFQNEFDKLVDQEMQRPSLVERHSQMNY
ncbi:unnamed protein product (macronuclear) [Paramecium tetraurelia]|uniref:Uncharacterized protein n=1 Tax=Paramecium tetraurelia TaxID=5888 RepID=A0DLY5_PARTE|nr:uncharacterized protein GSPATT00018270001 [Paramecium tetraurelia]CAK84052.1 unnamed protein product [Paramecium tetraurelia]|eukprot:XP_001451449.1 hypothetical protein (macronuclear) [Paramecium tetraurelia strain d4-2]